MQYALAVDAARLLQNSALNSSHPDLVEMLKDQLETSLGCMGLALHTVNSNLKYSGFHAGFLLGIRRCGLCQCQVILYEEEHGLEI